MLLCRVACVLSVVLMRVSGHITTCVFGSFSEVGYVTTFIRKHVFLAHSYCMDLTNICKITKDSFQEKSCNKLKSFLSFGFFKIMHDF